MTYLDEPEAAASYSAGRIDLTTLPAMIVLDASYSWRPRFHATTVRESVSWHPRLMEWRYRVRFDGPVLTPKLRDHATQRESATFESIEACPEVVRPLLRGPDALLDELARALPLPAVPAVP